ncbi:MAG: SDR family oxidoreductase [Alphaproteobacteria bacterium]|nr:SDR family oxidoreductase [Alphaproteobacteria bacterium]
MSKILFIGGTGNISLSCVEQAVKAGHDVSVFNRGRSIPESIAGVTQIVGDMDDDESYAQLADQQWDVVAQFMAFMPAQIQRDIDVFSGNTDHYIFISSASCYQHTPDSYIITELTPTINPYWKYSQNKIECESLLKSCDKLNWTIVRPSHTVRTWLPTLMSEDIVWRLQNDRPLLVPGDGNAPWTMTRSQDFAVPFVALMGVKEAYFEDFHITGDVGFTWDAIYQQIAKSYGKTAKIVHVSTDTIVAMAPDLSGALLGDKAWTALFDNSKIKRVAGDFSCEANLEKILSGPLAWTKANSSGSGPSNPELEANVDRIIEAAVRQ